MLKFKALEDRQILIEEIYAELESLLLPKDGNADDEEEDKKEQETQNKEEEEEQELTDSQKRLLALQKLDPSQMTDAQRKKYFFNLIAELEEKKAMLAQSLSVLSSLIKNNKM